MSPPPWNGIMVSSTFFRTHSTPIPVGPSILCPENAKKSHPISSMFTFMWGTAWAPSISVKISPGASLHIWIILWASVIVPRTFDIRLKVTSFTLPVARYPLRSSKINWPSSSTPMYFSLAPFSCASSCHGTMLLWCSYSVVTMMSSFWMWGRPQEYATRFIASVVPRTKTISWR